MGLEWEKAVTFLNKIVVVLLFVIASSLVFISWSIYRIPTAGEFMELKNLHDPAAITKAKNSINNRLPLMRLYGSYGSLSVDVENTVDVEVQNTVDVSGEVSVSEGLITIDR